tara:strand:+ start:199 stop:1008 length:810 start_codon:yes stop_codon:yes gene_type:complete
MKIISDKNKLIYLLKKEKNLGFVPTMGDIHAGHISLIKKSIKQCQKTIVSIFINKPQFNREVDYQKYPRRLDSDKFLLKKIKVNYLFLPTQKQIYPKGINKNIKIHKFSRRLCGKYRPGHFKAVADVIDRFISIIKPKRIFFGEKDMQQLKIMENFIKKKYPNIKVISCKTIREKNGIALSSRNKLLSHKEKIVASKIFRIIFKNKKKILKKRLLIKVLKKKIYSLGCDKIDYIEILDVNKILKSHNAKNKNKIFIAYYLGGTRLIDNI